MAVNFLNLGHTPKSFPFPLTGYDFILISGGHSSNGGALAGSSLIRLDATDEQNTSCVPPGDMLVGRQGHMVKRAGEHLLVCGGKSNSQLLKSCELYDRQTATWVKARYRLSKTKSWYPSVQLNDTMIWIGRELTVSLSSCATAVIRHPCSLVAMKPGQIFFAGISILGRVFGSTG